MPREIHDREDLLRDARALVPRLSLQFLVGPSPVNLVAGFRGDALSLYFGEDPVFHFNGAGELRRAFVAGQLIKATRGRMVGLQRNPAASAIELAAHDLGESLQQQLLDDLARRLAQVCAALASGTFTLIGQEPPKGDALARLRDWLTKRQKIEVAASPRVG